MLPCLPAASLLRTSALIALLSIAGPAPAAEVRDIWNLLDAGKAAEAYQTANRSLPEGSPDRDLLMGVAAAGEDRAEEAVLRLRRHLEAFPAHRQNPRARLELGRAYFRLGKLDAAQAEFEKVLEEEPPQPVADNIRQALALIAQERAALQPRVAGFVEVGGGYDSNINSGVPDPDVTVPIFGELRLGEPAVERDAAVGTLAAGIEVNRALRRDLGVYAAARVDSRFHVNHSDLDQFGTSLSAGVSRALDKTVLRGSLSWNGMQLDWDTYRQAYNASLEISRQWDEHTGLGIFWQMGLIKYQGTNRPRDADTFTLGAAWSRALGGEMKPLLRLTGNYTLEDNRRNHAELGRELPSLRASLELRPAERWSVATGVTWQQARHRAVGEFNTRRQDRYYAADAGINYQAGEQWNVGADLQYSKNTSNVDLYEYDRTVVMVKVRRDIR